MKKCIFIFASIVMLVMSGCSSLDKIGDIGAYETGTAISQKKMSLAIDGKSTKKDISTLFGHPNRKEQIGAKELWYYDYTKIVTIGSNVSESTVFEFNAKGILSQHYKTNKAGKTGNALLDAVNS